MNETLWCCHVYGPDDLYAAASFDEALRIANNLNAAVVKRAAHPDEPHVVAVAEPWPYAPEAHAAALLTPANDDPPNDEGKP